MPEHLKVRDLVKLPQVLEIVGRRAQSTVVVGLWRCIVNATGATVTILVIYEPPLRLINSLFGVLEMPDGHEVSIIASWDRANIRLDFNCFDLTQLTPPRPKTRRGKRHRMRVPA